MSLLEATDVVVRFTSHDALGRRRSLTVVAGVSLCLEEGERLGVVGESGSGKTTLGRALLALEQVAGGTVSFRGEDVHALRGKARLAFRRSAQMVFQDPMGSLNPRMKIGETLSEVLAVHKVVPKAERPNRVMELLAQVGLTPSYAGRYPHEFSGGQRQRVGLARALALNPALVVADEPVSALDVSVQAQVLNLLKDISEQRHMACILIAHDLAVVNYVCQKVMVMYRGRVVESGPSVEVLGHPLHPYTQALRAAVPDPDDQVARTQVSEPKGMVLEREVEGGCSYASRCSLACELCWREVPVLCEADGKGRRTACHRVERNDPGR
jgi:oligopeptide/dipeptide ABC transporter ATP-binding protein